jgi:hypothetical protein
MRGDRWTLDCQCNSKSATSDDEKMGRKTRNVCEERRRNMDVEELVKRFSPKDSAAFVR